MLVCFIAGADPCDEKEEWGKMRMGSERGKGHLLSFFLFPGRLVSFCTEKADVLTLVAVGLCFA